MDTNYTIAFYNLENLFDTEDNPYTFDDDFLPQGKKFWTKNRYQTKIRKLGRAISSIGSSDSNNNPVLLGVAEVENALVIEDLLDSKYLNEFNYDYVHYDSPDERGIDVALIYDKSIFTLVHSEPLGINLYDENGERDYTRDVLYVELKFENSIFQIIVAHLPSRRKGVDETNAKRVLVANQIRTFLESKLNDSSKVIVMGDFNDNPDCESLKEIQKNELLFNPFNQLQTINRGSLSYYNDWFLFDQILLSHNFLNPDEFPFKFEKADIFDEHFLQEWHGKRKGIPFRTYRGHKYTSGFSDHFPVYVNVLLNK